MSDFASQIERLTELVKEARVIVPFTGAGISTESGIPDFRSPGGAWTRNPPIDYRAFVADQAMRDEAWRRRFAMEPYFAAARPSTGHLAVAQWHASGQAPVVITQNIDNLHQASGIPVEQVIELHGNTTYAHCIGCHAPYALAWVRDEFEGSGERAPDCPACGQPVKTATISFGQAMPREAVQRAAQHAQACDLFIVIGSSLVVWPAAGLPVLAHQNGAKLVIINREPTELDSLAELVIRGEIADALSLFVPTGA